MATLRHEPSGIGRLRLRVTAWDGDWIERETLDTEAPAPLAGALDWLAAHGAAFSIAQFEARFPGLAPADARQVLSLLARAGFLKSLRFPLAKPSIT
jgi:hypothetical protein